MTQVTITLDDTLLQRASNEATRSFDGQLDSAFTAALNYYLPLRETGHDLDAQVTTDGAAASLTRIREVLTSRGVSSDTLGTLGAMLTSLATDAPTQPNDLAQWLNPYLDWCAADPATHELGAILVSTQTSGDKLGSPEGAPPVSYASGWLRGQGTSLDGDLQQVFSDRTAAGTTNPFDPTRGESLGLNLTLETTTGLTAVTLTAHAWGNARQSLTNLRVTDGLLLARGDSIGRQGNSALFAVSLYTVIAPE